jgi:hypothetical protein
MGLFAKHGQGDRPVTNQRAANGPPEGEPGESIVITIMDAFPPVVITAVVQPDGWFSDEVYDQIDAATSPR